MEPIRFVPLYFVAMPQSIITIIEAPFVSAPIITIIDIKSRPHTLRGTKFVNLHKDFLKKVNKIFASQPSYQRGGGSNPQGPLGFGLPMVHPSKSSLPPSKPYR
jgi:hypothetical protein